MRIGHTDIGRKAREVNAGVGSGAACVGILSRVRDTEVVVVGHSVLGVVVEVSGTRWKRVRRIVTRAILGHGVEEEVGRCSPLHWLLVVETHGRVRGSVAVGRCRSLIGRCGDRDLNRQPGGKRQHRVMGVKGKRGTKSVFGGLEGFTKGVLR